MVDSSFHLDPRGPVLNLVRMVRSGRMLDIYGHVSMSVIALGLDSNGLLSDCGRSWLLTSSHTENRPQPFLKQPSIPVSKLPVSRLGPTIHLAHLSDHP